HRWNTTSKDLPSDKLGGDREYKIEVLDISPDGKWAIASFFDQVVILLYSIERQSIEEYFELGEATALQFLNNNNEFVAALSDGRVIRYNILQKAERLLLTNSTPITTLAFHEAASLLLIADEEGRLFLGSLGGEFYTQKIHESAINALKFSKNGRLLLTASADQTAKLWSVDNRQELNLLYTLTGHQSAVTQVGFDKEEQTIFTVAEQIRKWKLPIILPDNSFVSSSSINSISSTQNLVFAATNRTGINIWEKASSQPNLVLQNISNRKMTALAANEDLLVAGDESGKIYFLQSDSQALLDSFTSIHQASIRKILIAEKHLAILAEDKTISIWEKKNRSHLSTLKHTANVIDMTFSEDEKSLYSISVDGKLQAWSLNDFQVKIRYENFETDFTHLIYHSDSQYLITATSSDSLQFWQLNGTPIKQISLPSSIASLEALPAGRLAVGTADGLVLILDKEGNAYHQLKLGANNPATDLLWDGERLLVATENFEIQLWKISQEMPFE
ncbi:MAG: WD40 repeat domain-containing protein, partial [Bacteroidota bacterium]